MAEVERAARLPQWRRSITAAAILAVLGGCARDVVDKPAALAVSNQTRGLAIATGRFYDSIVDGYNNALIDFVALNRGCRWGDSVTLHTPRSIALSEAERERRLRGLRRNDSARKLVMRNFRAEGCLTRAERAYLEKQSFGPGEAPNTVRLSVLSRRSFRVRFELLATLVHYSETLADLADAPKVTAKEDLLGVVDKLLSVANDANGIASALDSLTKPDEKSKPFLNFDGKAIRGEAELIGKLADQIETIVKQGQDDKAIRRLAIASQPKVDETIAGLRKGFIRDFSDLIPIAEAGIGTAVVQLDQDENMAFPDRRALIKRSAEIDVEVKRLHALLREQQAAGDDTAKDVLPEVRLADALRDANTELVRVANGRYTKKEKRAIASATLSRLRDVFETAAAAAGPLLAL